MQSSNANGDTHRSSFVGLCVAKSKVSNVESEQRVMSGTLGFHKVLNDATRARRVLPGTGTASGRQVEQAMSCA